MVDRVWRSQRQSYLRPLPGRLGVTPLPLARLQITCDASPNATNYRFYTQRPIVDPEPILAGSATEPLFVTEPVNATPHLAAAA